MKIVLDTNVVTNDHHFDILRQTPYPYVNVIALAEFAELLNECNPIPILHPSPLIGERDGSFRQYNVSCFIFRFIPDGSRQIIQIAKTHFNL